METATEEKRMAAIGRQLVDLFNELSHADHKRDVFVTITPTGTRPGTTVEVWQKVAWSPMPIRLDMAANISPPGEHIASSLCGLIEAVKIARAEIPF